MQLLVLFTTEILTWLLPSGRAPCWCQNKVVVIVRSGCSSGMSVQGIVVSPRLTPSGVPEKAAQPELTPVSNSLGNLQLFASVAPNIFTCLPRAAGMIGKGICCCAARSLQGSFPRHCLLPCCCVLLGLVCAHPLQIW